ncbi:Ribose-5-phosphate isomerase A [Aquisphaera giovannonii]|uniref:Ribose-5-phosphate isomerase A n=1 Tax=Aquisphaera giovannonii TaxID=406548 RepID=A0A5B9VXK0_9BACT|nr:ribose-5-phosphate isomerase RpiA [Aquisphaera giovannonii]QEH33008.1 Ribose-5-phosphate isomerase A [Aquisphaera giovannonii]
MASIEEPAKERAAREAAGLVQSGMTVGLGSGTTAAILVRRLGERMREEGLRFVGVPTSVATAELARGLGIPLRELDEVDALDINLDGADEVDPQFRMIKGRGGALLREKIVACVARRRVTVITQDKRVSRLGQKAPLPVEVSSIGLQHTERRLRAMGAVTRIRMGPPGVPFRTDGGNAIIDCTFAGRHEPEELDGLLRSVVGVFETGLFLGLCDLLVVGTDDGVEQVPSTSPRNRGCGG